MEKKAENEIEATDYGQVSYKDANVAKLESWTIITCLCHQEFPRCKPSSCCETQV